MSQKAKSLSLIKSNKHFLSLLSVAQRRGPQKPSSEVKEIDMKQDLPQKLQNGGSGGAETGVGGLQVRDGPE